MQSVSVVALTGSAWREGPSGSAAGSPAAGAWYPAWEAAVKGGAGGSPMPWSPGAAAAAAAAAAAEAAADPQRRAPSSGGPPEVSDRGYGTPQPAPGLPRPHPAPPKSCSLGLPSSASLLHPPSPSAWSPRVRGAPGPRFCPVQGRRWSSSPAPQQAPAGLEPTNSHWQAPGCSLLLF